MFLFLRILPTFVITLSLPMQSRIRYHTPISRTRCDTGRLWWVNSFFASSRISKILFSRAKNGASGKAATKMVTKPYCKTISKYSGNRPRAPQSSSLKSRIQRSSFALSGFGVLLKSRDSPTWMAKTFRQNMGRYTSRIVLNACLPTIIMANWMHSSVKQPPDEHCKIKSLLI